MNIIRKSKTLERETIRIKMDLINLNIDIKINKEKKNLTKMKMIHITKIKGI